MYASLYSAAVVGVDAIPVRVEAFVSNGLPSFTVVGLPGVAVQESRERVRAAVKQLGLSLPPSRIVVNLAPADLRKEGPAFDLPIALALLAADKRLPSAALEGLVAFGELALDGSIRPVRGAVSMAMLASERGWAKLLVPPGNAPDAAQVQGARAVAPATLSAALLHLTGRKLLKPVANVALTSERRGQQLDLADVRGQAFARRALEVAAAGRHNLLMTGPPGSGKTMLALRLPSILPPLTVAEALDVSRVRSSAGIPLDGRQGKAAEGASSGLNVTPPFRAPHHSSSNAGLLGGGAYVRPGEVSLAHNGVLFLDELPEFSRSALEALRQPVEDGKITVSRAGRSVTLPARFQLIAARNPCPCGHAGTPSDENDPTSPVCHCSPHDVTRYQRRVSGPLLDRMGILLRVPRLTKEELLGSAPAEPSAAVAARVTAARQVMLRRQGHTNSLLGRRDLESHSHLTPAAARLLEQLAAGRVSGRGFERLMRLARTIADLAASPEIADNHLAEAAAYRNGA